MKGQLFNLSHSMGHEEVLKEIAMDLYHDMIKQCKKAAKYGNNEIEINVTTLKTYKWTEDEKIYQHLNSMLSKESLLKKIVFPVYLLSWLLSPEEEKMPRVTTRDLVDAGYRPEQFGTILKGLKTAMVNGYTVGNLQSELIWVKNNFK